MKSLNQRLHELQGKCVHDGISRCRKCHARYHLWPVIPDYTRWEHYGPLLEFIMQHKNFRAMPEVFIHGMGEWEYFSLHECMSNPTRGCEAIAKFFCGGE